jgi:hypothetical protein
MGCGSSLPCGRGDMPQTEDVLEMETRGRRPEGALPFHEVAMSVKRLPKSVNLHRILGEGAFGKVWWVECWCGCPSSLLLISASLSARLSLCLSVCLSLCLCYS